MKKICDIKWEEIVDYDNDTGYLYFKGQLKRAGSYDMRGYRRLGYQRKSFKEHRIIWYLHHGVFDETKEIDHINQNKTDNRIENLRLVDSGTNKRNRPRQKNNISGINGVHWQKQRNRWCASIKVGGKKLNLGYFAKKDEAIIARRSAEKALNFSKRHGTNVLL